MLLRERVMKVNFDCWTLLWLSRVHLWVTFLGSENTHDLNYKMQTLGKPFSFKFQTNATKHIKQVVSWKKQTNLFLLKPILAHSIANWLKWACQYFTGKNTTAAKNAVERQERSKERKEGKCKHWTCRISGKSELAMWNSRTNKSKECVSKWAIFEQANRK